VYYPPAEERVSHFRPVYDFFRISVLNTILCIVALFFRSFYFIKQALNTIFSFCYFIVDAIILTGIGFLLITIGGATEKHKYLYHRLLQKNARFIIHHVPGTKFTWHNPQGEDFQKPSIIISNHQSHLDLMAIMMLTPKLIILTKKWVWHSPFYGIIIRYADYFPITDTEEMITKMQAKIDEGYSVMIFPEGTRSEDCKIKLFQRGAFYLAEQLKLDILPVFIKGFGKVLPKKSYYLHPGKMSLEVKSRICRDQLTAEENYRELSKRIRRQYLKWNHEEVKLYKR
jgi:1-acyl-sn-glycerol-3-phosphate acyltransferase